MLSAEPPLRGYSTGTCRAVLETGSATLHTADSILPGPSAQVWAGVVVGKTGLRLRPGLGI